MSHLAGFPQGDKSGFSNDTHSLGISVRGCNHNPQHEWEHRNECKRLRLESEKAGRKRRKEVFDTGEIPHLWAHKVQDSGRNPQGNLYFASDVIYSYGSHFPIARHVTNKKEKSAILFTTSGYSSTTSGHISAVRSAIPPNVPVFNVSDLFPESRGSHAVNLADYAKRIDAALVIASRARSSWNKEHSHGQAVTLRNEYNGYLKLFGLRNKPLAAIPALDSQALADIRKREAVKAARQAEQTKRGKAERLAKLQDAITAWRANDSNYAGGTYSFYEVPTMLRIVGDEVETSRGARVPVAHAKRALTLVRAVVARGEAWQTNGHTCHVGHYQLDRIEANGTLKAGCHVIARDEWERIAPALDALISDTTASAE